MGTDQMGGGIAVVGAQAGLRVLLHDASEAALDGALEAILRLVRRLEARQKLKKYVDAGYLGRKSARGFYAYQNGELVSPERSEHRPWA